MIEAIEITTFQLVRNKTLSDFIAVNADVEIGRASCRERV